MEDNHAQEKKFNQRDKRMIIGGLGPLEIIWALSLFGYMCYNGYMVWKASEGDKEY